MSAARHSVENQPGFTLLEMSLVITIIGLIVGGIMIAQSMIRNSQLQAVTGEVARYTQAVIDFRDKYRALPGDFAGATALWGSADGVIPSDAACESTIGTGTQTCDGNGDGRIASATMTTAGQYEQFRAWQHLANAGMIDGNYSGVAGPLYPSAVIIGTNTPGSQLQGAGYVLTSVRISELSLAPYINNYYSGIDYGAILQFGANTGKTAFSEQLPSIVDDAWAVAMIQYSTTMGAVLTPGEALLVDSKVDDGNPGSGKVLSLQMNSPVAPNCTTSNSASTATYNTTRNYPSCALVFELGF